MTGPGSAISISLEELETRIRAIVGRRQAFPTSAQVQQTGGPAGGASSLFRWRLEQAGIVLGGMTDALGRQLHDLEHLLTVTGQDIVATDESVAGDVSAIHRIADTVAVPPAPGGATGTGPAASPSAQPAPSTTTDDGSDGTIE